MVYCQTRTGLFKWIKTVQFMPSGKVRDSQLYEQRGATKQKK